MTSLQNHHVICLHGLLGHPWLLVPLSRAISKAGYTVERFGYRSLFYSAEYHAAQLAQRLEIASKDPEIRQLSIVAHSLGAILTRMAVTQVDCRKLSRIIMLAPPNAGSGTATRLARRIGWISNIFYELSDNADSLARRLPRSIAVPDHTDVGVIRATNDFVVTPESTRLDNVQHYATVSGMHSAMLMQKNTANQVIHFLNAGTYRAA